MYGILTCACMHKKTVCLEQVYFCLGTGKGDYFGDRGGDYFICLGISSHVGFDAV